MKLHIANGGLQPDDTPSTSNSATFAAAKAAAMVAGGKVSSTVQKPTSSEDAISAASDVLKTAANKTTAAASKATSTSEVATSDLTNELTSLTGSKSDLAAVTKKAADDVKSTTPMKIYEDYKTAQDQILKDKTTLAQQQIDQAQTLSKWYSGLNKSYEDIAARYNNAITGLGDQERTKLQGQNQQDYMAMSGVAQMNIAGQGRMQTGTQLQLQQAAGSQAASGAYSAAQQRMQDLDTQRRQMQFQVVQNSMSQELSNKQAGYGMEAGVMSVQQGIQNNLMDTRQNMADQQYGARSGAYGQSMNTFMSGTQGMATGAQSIYGAKTSQAQQSFGYGMSGIEAEANAGTYAPTMQLGLNYQKDQIGMAQQGIDISKQTLDFQKQAQTENMWAGIFTGVLGAGATYAAKKG